MTITDRIASLAWDYTIAHNARPTTLRLTSDDERALDAWVHIASKTDVYGTSPSRFMGMVIELDAKRTEVC